MADLLTTIQYLVPLAQLSCIGTPNDEHEYQTMVTWEDDRPQPTWAEIEAARPAAETATANAQAQANRRQAFTAEADPLFFAWQRGESTEQAWLDKCADIRARFPYA